MTNEELIARLRMMPTYSGDPKGPHWLPNQAADRIEALIAERDAAEAKLAKAVEALEALIQLAHDCEKELTEDLHHMDFCGESEPLTKARATLAEIKSHSDEFATQKGESDE